MPLELSAIELPQAQLERDTVPIGVKGFQLPNSTSYGIASPTRSVFSRYSLNVA